VRSFALLALVLAGCIQIGTSAQDAGAPHGSDASSSSDAPHVQAKAASCTRTGFTCTSSDLDTECYALTARIYDGKKHCLGPVQAVACCAAPSSSQTGVAAEMSCASADRTGCIVATLATGETYALYTPETWLDPPSGFTPCEAATARDILTVAGCAQ
jgi:hypothetical protein